MKLTNNNNVLFTLKYVRKELKINKSKYIESIKYYNL